MKKQRPELIYFASPKNCLKSLLEDYDEFGITAIENHHLSPVGLIKKMLVWDEAEHGVEAYIYDLTKKELERLGFHIPKEIRRIK